MVLKESLLIMNYPQHTVWPSGGKNSKWLYLLSWEIHYNEWNDIWQRLPVLHKWLHGVSQCIPHWHACSVNSPHVTLIEAQEDELSNPRHIKQNCSSRFINSLFYCLWGGKELLQEELCKWALCQTCALQETNISDCWRAQEVLPIKAWKEGRKLNWNQVLLVFLKKHQVIDPLHKPQKPEVTKIVWRIKLKDNKFLSHNNSSFFLNV